MLHTKHTSAPDCQHTSCKVKTHKPVTSQTTNMNYPATNENENYSAETNEEDNNDSDEH